MWIGEGGRDEGEEMRGSRDQGIKGSRDRGNEGCGGRDQGIEG